MGRLPSGESQDAERHARARNSLRLIEKRRFDHKLGIYRYHREWSHERDVIDEWLRCCAPEVLEAAEADPVACALCDLWPVRAVGDSRRELCAMHLTKVTTQEVRYEQMARVRLEYAVLTTTLVIETRGGEKLELPTLVPMRSGATSTHSREASAPPVLSTSRSAIRSSSITGTRRGQTRSPPPSRRRDSGSLGHRAARKSANTSDAR
jgi:hypothetical protein